MTVKLDSLHELTIELALTHERVKSLRKVAQNAAAAPENEKSRTDAALDAVFEQLSRWAEQMETGCCESCNAQGHVGGEACIDCLGTGHSHSPNSLCPKKVAAEGEGWMQVHKRAVEMRDEANRLLHVSQHEMRCPHKVEEEGWGNLIQRCALNKGHSGKCNPKGSDTA